MNHETNPFGARVTNWNYDLLLQGSYTTGGTLPIQPTNFESQ